MNLLSIVLFLKIHAFHLGLLLKDTLIDLKTIAYTYIKTFRIAALLNKIYSSK